MYRYLYSNIIYGYLHLCIFVALCPYSKSSGQPIWSFLRFLKHITKLSSRKTLPICTLTISVWEHKHNLQQLVGWNRKSVGLEGQGRLLKRAAFLKKGFGGVRESVACPQEWSHATNLFIRQPCENLVYWVKRQQSETLVSSSKVEACWRILLTQSIGTELSWQRRIKALPVSSSAFIQEPSRWSKSNCKSVVEHSFL